MAVLIGLLIGVVFFCWSALCVYAGYRIGKIPTSVDKEKRENDLHKHFTELMNYDVSKAIQRKKVT